MDPPKHKQLSNCLYLSLFLTTSTLPALAAANHIQDEITLQEASNALEAKDWQEYWQSLNLGFEQAGRVYTIRLEYIRQSHCLRNQISQNNQKLRGDWPLHPNSEPLRLVLSRQLALEASLQKALIDSFKRMQAELNDIQKLRLHLKLVAKPIFEPILKHTKSHSL
jgi:hypothetical protein